MINIDCENEKPNTTKNSEYDPNDKDYMAENDMSTFSVNKI